MTSVTSIKFRTFMKAFYFELYWNNVSIDCACPYAAGQRFLDNDVGPPQARARQSYQYRPSDSMASIGA